MFLRLGAGPIATYTYINILQGIAVGACGQAT